MTDDPRWHGWATPEQVRQMMQEMYQFLEDNNESCLFERAKIMDKQSWIEQGYRHNADL